MLSKSIQTTNNENKQSIEIENKNNNNTSSSSSDSTTKSLWSMFSNDWLPTSIVPTNILGVPIVDIQSDFREGTTQISDL